MRLWPEDLGYARCVRLLRWRGPIFSGGVARAAQLHTLPSSQPLPVARRGLLGRYWAWGLKLNPDLRDAGIAVLSDDIRGTTMKIASSNSGWLTAFFGIVLILCLNGGQEAVIGVVSCWLAAMAICRGLYPRVVLQRLFRQPLSEDEIDWLLHHSTDDLERAFLALVYRGLCQPMPAEAERAMRAAIRALAQSLDALPAISSAEQDIDALRERAAKAAEAAHRENDPVVSDSLGRQAEALRRSADAAERLETASRRADALRQEMEAQIGSLRVGLRLLRSDAADLEALSRVAAAARMISEGAASVSAAREELNAYLAGNPSSSPAPTLVQARAGNMNQ